MRSQAIQQQVQEVKIMSCQSMFSLSASVLVQLHCSTPDDQEIRLVLLLDLGTKHSQNFKSMQGMPLVQLRLTSKAVRSSLSRRPVHLALLQAFQIRKLSQGLLLSPALLSSLRLPTQLSRASSRKKNSSHRSLQWLFQAYSLYSQGGPLTSARQQL